MFNQKVFFLRNYETSSDVRFQYVDNSKIMKKMRFRNYESSTMRFIHINEYEYMNNYAQYIILHTRIRIQ